MAWYDEAIFYHIYPLGLCGAPKENQYGEPVHPIVVFIVSAEIDLTVPVLVRGIFPIFLYILKGKKIMRELFIP